MGGVGRALGQGIGKVWENKGAPMKGFEYCARRHPLMTAVGVIAIALVVISLMVFVFPSMGGLGLIMPAALVGLGVTLVVGHILCKNPKHKKILETITSVVAPVLMVAAGVTLMLLGPMSFFSLAGMGLIPGAVLIATHHTTPHLVDLAKRKRHSKLAAAEIENFPL